MKASSAAAAAEAPAPELTPGKFGAASRVLTGQIPCEFGQTIQIAPVDGKPGFFEMVSKETTYTLAPHETTTGAVRLEDRKVGAGIAGKKKGSEIIRALLDGGGWVAH